MVKRAMEDAGVDPKTFAPRAILSAISGAKSKLLDAEAFRLAQENPYDEIVHRVYDAYERLLAQSSAVDFDDLLLKVYQLLHDVPDVAERYQRRYAQFMVDEFPGHQRGPVRHRQEDIGGEQEPVRGRRPRPVDLLLAQRGHPQHPSASGTTIPRPR